jgi:hypothetical protein
MTILNLEGDELSAFGCQIRRIAPSRLNFRLFPGSRASPFVLSAKC